MISSLLITFTVAAQVAFGGFDDAPLSGHATARGGQIGALPSGETKASELHDLTLLSGPGVNVPSLLAQLSGDPGQAYMLTLLSDEIGPTHLDTGRLDSTGQLEIAIALPDAALGQPLTLRADFISGRTPVASDSETHEPNAIDICFTQDFESYFSLLDNGDGFSTDTVAGEIVLAQWLIPSGFLYGAVNFSPFPSHPWVPVIFDTFNPTGGDDDLSSPAEGGQGGADGDPVEFIDPVPYGKVLIVQENDEGCFDDFICDTPDDENAGGAIGFLSIGLDIFDGEELVEPRPIVLCSMDLLDIDESVPFDEDGDDEFGAIVITLGLSDQSSFEDPEALLAFVAPSGQIDLEGMLAADGIDIVDFIPVPTGPDNCFKRVYFSGKPIIAGAVIFAGSGALAEFKWSPLTQ